MSIEIKEQEKDEKPRMERWKCTKAKPYRFNPVKIPCNSRSVFAECDSCERG